MVSSSSVSEGHLPVQPVSRGRQGPSPPPRVVLSDLALGWVGLYADIDQGLLIVPQGLPFPSPQQA